MSNDKIKIELSLNAALVFYEWLSRYNKAENIQFEDQAEQRVLWDIEAILESALVEPFSGRYEEMLAQARAKVRDPDD